MRRKRGPDVVYSTVSKLRSDFTQGAVPDPRAFHDLPYNLRYLWRLTWLSSTAIPADAVPPMDSPCVLTSLERSVAQASVMSPTEVLALRRAVVAHASHVLPGRIMYVTGMLYYLHSMACAPPVASVGPVPPMLSIFSTASLRRCVQVPELRSLALIQRFRMEMRAGEMVLSQQQVVSSGHKVELLERMELLRPSRTVADMVSLMTHGTLDGIMAGTKDSWARDALCLAAFGARVRSAVVGFDWLQRCVLMVSDIETMHSVSDVHRLARVVPIIVFRLKRYDVFRSDQPASFVTYASASSAITAWRRALADVHGDCVDSRYRFSGILES